MDPSQQDEASVSSPESATTSSTWLSIPSSNYLTVPTTRPSNRFFPLPGPVAFVEDDLELPLVSLLEATSNLGPETSQAPRLDTPPVQPSPPSSYTRRRSRSPARGSFMSVYSASSVETDHSTYSNPPARLYRVPSFQNMSSRRISPVCPCYSTRGMPADTLQVEKEQMLSALNTHQVNTLAELRRIEKAFAYLGSPDVSAPMTAACMLYHRH